MTNRKPGGKNPVIYIVHSAARFGLSGMALLLAIAGGPAGAAESEVAPATQIFRHPGVLLSLNQLNFMKAQVVAKADPFYSAYLKAIASPYGKPTYKLQGPPANGAIECGSYSHPNLGCTAADNDGTAAYTQALLYWITGNKAYAANAIAILNAYAKVKSYSLSNAPLQAAWDGSKWPRAAEIIRAANVGWAPPDIAAFSAMLTNAIVPGIYAGSPDNGNWELSMIEAMMGIAVFTENSSLFQHAVTFWQQRIPSYMYNFALDGDKPVPPPRGKLDWHGQKIFNASTTGILQETCRDFGHTQFGIAAAINGAETAAIQGVDLYGSERTRIEASLEFTTYYISGKPVPSTVCRGKVNIKDTYQTFEIAYNAFHNRLGDALPNTYAWIVGDVRKTTDYYDAGSNHMIVEETLTHGGNGN
ncbi:MAG TPA: alginate lyase family protein [Aliidongia sp.]|uniref:alginate lyase family protein n=1 Tax=Aliidongia sp. TaxID=1914230 RepID=UPI002DDCBFA8|nr:alginate lyase family protein [Aliidongia sp.]HEV2673890.1 alginate lyase family protein [Aliidongia sp.]